MAKRINVILPESTIRTLNRLAKRGERSSLIDRAVKHYAETRTAEGLRAQLKTAAIRDRDLDVKETNEWVVVDHESWQIIDRDEESEQPRRLPRQNAGKSISRRSTRR